MVHAVGVVPEDPEIRRRGLHRGQPVHRFVAVADPLRVGIERHAPDALDRVIFGDQLFDHVHIRTVLGHRHRNHLDSEVLADQKMAVVTRTRAQELHRRQLAPRRMAAGSEYIKAHHRVVHQVQTGIAADDDLVHVDAEQVGKEAARFGNPLKAAVIAGVDAVAGDVIFEFIENGIGQVELGAGGFSARHVEFEILRDITGVSSVKLRLAFLQLRPGTFADIPAHNNSCDPRKVAFLRSRRRSPAFRLLRNARTGG